MLKKVLCIILCLAMFSAVAVSASAVQLPSVEGHWAQESLERWINAGVAKTTTVFSFETYQYITSFEPDSVLTRSEMAMYLDEIFKWDEMAENKFSDLAYKADGSFLTDPKQYVAVLHANAAGIIKGDGSGTVRPGEAVTRQDLCTTICRAFEIEAIEGKTGFKDDARISDYARGSVAAMSAAGYLKGYPDGSFKPLQEITKAEMCVLLDGMRKDFPILNERLEEGDWYADYQDILVTSVPTYASGNPDADVVGSKDLYIRLWYPDNVPEGSKVPLVMYIHGGAWIGGNRSELTTDYLVKHMLDNGIAVASLTYRFSTEASMPYPLYDLQAQIRYLRVNANKLGLDANRFGVTGESAGGHLAALVATTGNSAQHQDPGVVTFEGDVRSTSTRMQFCGWQYGIGDMFAANGDSTNDYRIFDKSAGSSPMIAMLFGLDDVEGPPVDLAELKAIWDKKDRQDPNWYLAERVAKGSAIYWVDRDDPPFFFYNGSADDTTPIKQALDMYGALCSAGVKGCEFRVCEKMGHNVFMHPQYYYDMCEWFVAQAKK